MPLTAAGTVPPALAHDPLWWRSAVIYQVYVRSFADSDGDGTGDLRGVLSRLDYLADLGVDALWFNPWYPSPLADGGYDVADYRDIHPAFGTLADAERLITAAAERGIRTIIDIVPNHVSSRHPWFEAALAAGPGSPERERFWFHPGKGPNGDEMPTRWVSNFQGDTWTRTVNPDGTPGEWYLHLFTPEQPDLNWNHPDVRAEHEEILRFWFDRGVAGVRIDSAGLLIKDPELREVPETVAPGQHPTEDRDEVHEVYRSWRRIADSYDGTRVLVGEVWVPDAARFAAYLRPDEMHTAFNFDFMSRPWAAGELRASIDLMLAAHAPVGAPSTWVLSNHDVTRPVTRYGRDDSSFAFAKKRFGTPTDVELGTRRARAAALLTAALPGSLYLYQGDELGLPEVELPRDVLEDPMHYRSGGVDPGRDGCRVPLPWRGTTAPFGFGPDGAAPWLPQPDEWASLTVQAQQADPSSMLWLYRQALALRKREAALGDGPMTWIDAGADVLCFRRGDDLVSITNLGRAAVALPDHESILLASSPLEAGLLPADATAWLRVAPAPRHP
ncbi:glycoside hydrolase family 13 protein [Agromyces sp. H3Y2-19a]|uniref:glycoside hydrolase family 13 protein n=1 Tax=Agromyces TaxID=33877 RepID=UPI001E5D03D0|nr:MULTISPECIES: glycoside hydrolase family 13 protein [Agromyces]MCD5345068.1 glycoside hydrolase family 13 protein [Agromyces sp. S2-1-8]MDF0513774.1 glycoside hydrolase family 13 protein [Agromyces chromiiresistens]